MSQAQARLEKCRELLMDIRGLEETIVGLPDPGETPEDVEQLRMARAMLLSRRRQYTSAVTQAASVLDLLGGSERTACWMWYIRGMTNKEAADEMKCSVREAQRRRARALERLEAMDG